MSTYYKPYYQLIPCKLSKTMQNMATYHWADNCYTIPQFNLNFKKIKKIKLQHFILTLFLRYSSIARNAESVSFTKINSLFSLKFPCDDKPYWTPAISAAISVLTLALRNQLTLRGQNKICILLTSINYIFSTKINYHKFFKSN